MSSKLKSILITTFLTTIAIIIIYFSWGDLTQFHLWQTVDTKLPALPNLSLFKIIHLLISLPVFIYGSFNVVFIIDANSKAHSSNLNPDIIVKDGYYGKVRHPMYSMFILMISSFAFAMSSWLTIPIAVGLISLLMAFGLGEEKYILIPKFKEQYLQYKETVKQRYFLWYHLILIFMMLAFAIIGAFF